MSQKQWLTSNFKFVLDGMPTDRVSSIDSFTWKCSVAADQVGIFREEAALKAGAVASFLGGSGPCVASFFDLSAMDGKEIGEAVRRVFESKGIKVDVWVGGWGKGCRRA